MKGNTIKEGIPVVVRQPMVVTEIELLSDDDYELQTLARYFVPKGRTYDIVKEFRKSFRIKSITITQTVGETICDAKKENDTNDSEWL
jgi:hypothetical protein